MLKKIDLMHEMFGKADGKCADCTNLISHLGTGRRRWFKCMIYGDTNSSASDWRQSYDACGMKDKLPANGMKAVIQLKHKKPETVCEGQISMFKEIEE